MEHRFNCGDKIAEMNSKTTMCVLNYNDERGEYVLMPEYGGSTIYTTTFIDAHFVKVGELNVGNDCENKIDNNETLLKKLQNAIAEFVCSLREEDANAINKGDDYLTVTAKNMLLERGLHLVMEKMGWKFFYYNGEVTFVEQNPNDKKIKIPY